MTSAREEGEKSRDSRMPHGSADIRTKKKNKKNQVRMSMIVARYFFLWRNGWLSHLPKADFSTKSPCNAEVKE